MLSFGENSKWVNSQEVQIPAFPRLTEIVTLSSSGSLISGRIRIDLSPWRIVKGAGHREVKTGGPRFPLTTKVTDYVVVLSRTVEVIVS
jgi:hypothetical protein